MSHYRLRRARAALAATLLLAVNACHGATAPADDVEIAMSSDRADIDPQQIAHLTVTVTNRGDASIEVFDPNISGCTPAYIVRDVVGHAVPLPRRVCLLIAYAPRILAPGETVTFADQWLGETVDSAGHVTIVAPGRYTIAARMGVEGRELESAPIVVRVH
jgi:hypothetical protein